MLFIGFVRLNPLVFIFSFDFYQYPSSPSKIISVIDHWSTPPFFLAQLKHEECEEIEFPLIFFESLLSLPLLKYNVNLILTPLSLSFLNL